MLLNAVVALSFVLVTLFWGMRGKGRGMFSSLVTLACVVCAGAVAFAAWEPLATNVFLGLSEGMAWGLALLAPFLVSVVVFRLLAETLVPRDIKVGDIGNFVGGAAFGAGTATISIGIIVISIGFFRFGPSMLGYEAIDDDSGSPVYANKLWVPVDRFTAAFYESLSLGSFATATPLAARAPDVHVQSAMSREVYADSDNTARNGIQPDQFRVLGRYRVGPRSAQEQIGSSSQKVFTPDGEAVLGSATVEGVVVEFASGAGESKGQIVVGPGQVRLVCEDGDGRGHAVHPFAIIAEPEAGAAGIRRFPVDTAGLFIPSVGAGSAKAFGFEFLVPDGWTPTDVLVKNARAELDGDLAEPSLVYGDTAERDRAIASAEVFSSLGASVGGAVIGDLDTSGSRAVQAGQRGRFEIIAVDARLPQGWVLNRTTGTGGLDTRESNIVRGEGQFPIEQLTGRGIDANLRVSQFDSRRDTSVVRVELATDGAMSLLGRAVERAESVLPPLLIDSQNRRYEAIGFIYSDGKTVSIRYTPDRPIRGLSELPERLSASKRDQTAYLLFQPTDGVTITAFVIGSKQVASFEPDGVEVR